MIIKNGPVFIIRTSTTKCNSMITSCIKKQQQQQQQQQQQYRQQKRILQILCNQFYHYRCYSNSKSCFRDCQFYWIVLLNSSKKNSSKDIIKSIHCNKQISYYYYYQQKRLYLCQQTQQKQKQIIVQQQQQQQKQKQQQQQQQQNQCNNYNQYFQTITRYLSLSSSSSSSSSSASSSSEELFENDPKKYDSTTKDVTILKATKPITITTNLFNTTDITDAYTDSSKSTSTTTTTTTTTTAIATAIATSTGTGTNNHPIVKYGYIQNPDLLSSKSIYSSYKFSLDNYIDIDDDIDDDDDNNIYDDIDDSSDLHDEIDDTTTSTSIRKKTNGTLRTESNNNTIVSTKINIRKNNVSDDSECTFTGFAIITLGSGTCIPNPGYIYNNNNNNNNYYNNNTNNSNIHSDDTETTTSTTDTNSATTITYQQLKDSNSSGASTSDAQQQQQNQQQHYQDQYDQQQYQDQDQHQQQYDPQHYTNYRTFPCTIVRINSHVCLFDCGEGVQRQLLHSRISISSIDKIFISSLHDGRMNGLPGFISKLNTIAREREDDYRIRNKVTRQEQRRRRSIISSSTNNNINYTKPKKIIEIYGPVGLYNYIICNVLLGQHGTSNIQLIIYELENDVQTTTTRKIVKQNTIFPVSKKFVTSKKNQSDGLLALFFPQLVKLERDEQQRLSKEKNAFTKTFSEFTHNMILRKSIHPTYISDNDNDNDSNNNTNDRSTSSQQQYKVWKLVIPFEINTFDDALQYSKNRTEKRYYYVTAAELTSPKANSQNQNQNKYEQLQQCFGYVIQEPYTMERTLDVKKAKEQYGIIDHKKYRLLKWGFSVHSDTDSTQIINANQVLIGIQPISRKATIINNCSKVSNSLVYLAKDSNILIHPATILSSISISSSSSSSPSLLPSSFDQQQQHEQKREDQKQFLPQVESKEEYEVDTNKERNTTNIEHNEQQQQPRQQSSSTYQNVKEKVLQVLSLLTSYGQSQQEKEQQPQNKVASSSTTTTSTTTTLATSIPKDMSQLEHNRSIQEEEEEEQQQHEPGMQQQQNHVHTQLINDYGQQSTASNAGSIAKQINAQVLLLNNFNPIVSYNILLQQKLINEAMEQIRNNTMATTTLDNSNNDETKTTRVQISFDYMEISIPRKTGFDFSQNK